MKAPACALALLALAVLSLLPIGVAVADSLIVDGRPAADHYRTAFRAVIASGSSQQHLLLNTLSLGAAATVLALLLGLPYAFLTSRR